MVKPGNETIEVLFLIETGASYLLVSGGRLGCWDQPLAPDSLSAIAAINSCESVGGTLKRSIANC